MIILSAYTNFMGMLDATDPMTKASMKLLGVSTTISSYLGAVAILIALTVMFVRNALDTTRMNDNKGLIDWEEVVRILSLYIFALTFIFWAPQLLNASNIMARHFSINTEEGQSFERRYQMLLEGGEINTEGIDTDFVVKVLQENKAGKDVDKTLVKMCENVAEQYNIDWENYKQVTDEDIREKGWGEKYRKGETEYTKPKRLVEWFDHMGKVIMALPVTAINAVLTSIALIVRAIVITINLILLKFIIIIGPLALCFGIMFKGHAKKYMKYFLNLCFAIVTIAIIDYLLLTYWGSFFKSLMDNKIGWKSIGDSNTIALVQIALYSLVWKVTTWWTATLNDAAGISTKSLAIAGAIGGMVAKSKLGQRANKTANSINDSKLFQSIRNSNESRIKN
jgi:hypothetical protein